ncbi:MAG: hypothetical protein U0V74_16820 [Chitinophagales bacterium]
MALVINMIINKLLTNYCYMKQLGLYFITVLLGTLVFFGIGYIVFELLLGTYTEAHTTHIAGFKKSANDFSFLFLTVSCAAYAILLTFILIRLLAEKRVVKAFLISSLTGMLIAVMTDTYWYASSYFYNDLLVLGADVLAAGLTVGFLGATVVAVYNTLSRLWSIV